MGVCLATRALSDMTLRPLGGGNQDYEILQEFPFTSESKRMGIILRERKAGGEILFLMKGADTVMSSIVQYNDWLLEEVDNMAREGLRILVVARKLSGAV